MEEKEKYVVSRDGAMSPDEFAKQMAEYRDKYCIDDEEVCHKCMDSLMCDLLRELGYGDGIDIFVHTPKWYA